ALPPLPTKGWAEARIEDRGSRIEDPGSREDRGSRNGNGDTPSGIIDARQPGALAAPEYPFARTPPLQGIQGKTMVLMAVAIICGLIAASMTSRLMESTSKEALYQNQPASYWSQKLQEPIQRKEVWQGHLKMLKDVDPAAALRQGDPEAVPIL